MVWQKKVAILVLLVVCGLQSPTMGLDKFDTEAGYKSFIENFALSRLPDPTGDAVAVITNSPAIMKTALLFWLHKQRSDAATQEDWVKEKRYTAFYNCLSNPSNCDDLQALESKKSGATIHLFSNVPSADSSKFKSDTYQEVSIGTTNYDKTPYHLANPYIGTVTVQQSQKCFLAGDSAGQTGWIVDNFLLFEIRTGMETKRLVCGAVDPVDYNGERVQQVGLNKFGFTPGEIDLTEYFPQGVPVQLKVSALDYGGSGSVTDVYLIIQ